MSTQDRHVHQIRPLLSTLQESLLCENKCLAHCIQFDPLGPGESNLVETRKPDGFLGWTTFKEDS